MELTSYSIAADPVHRLVYATDENSGSLIRPTAEIVNPVTATIGTTSTALSPWPGRVSSVSDDGQYLYVAMTDDTIARFALPSLTLDARFPLHANGEERSDAIDIEPMPGSPLTIAVAFQPVSTTRVEPSVAIYDGAVRRTQTTTAGSPYWFSGTPVQGVAWDPSHTASLYGTGTSGPNAWSAFSLAADASGVTTSGPFSTWSADQQSHRRLRLANGHLFHDSGEVIDVPQGTNHQLTTDTTIFAVILDIPHNKLFVIGEDPTRTGEGPPIVTMIHSLNLQTMAPISDVVLPGIVSNVMDAQRYGDDGIVFRLQDQLVFMSGAFVTN